MADPFLLKRSRFLVLVAKQPSWRKVAMEIDGLPYF